jgi:hypothetical protein
MSSADLFRLFEYAHVFKKLLYQIKPESGVFHGEKVLLLL